MNIIFVSNFMNHHQLELCNRLYAMSESFHFFCMKEMPRETQAFGYDDLSKLPYVIEKPQLDDVENPDFKALMNADVVIFGDCPTEYVRMRILHNKLTFIFSERMWKKGTYRRFIPSIRKKVARKFMNYPNVYVLGASCYLAQDLNLIGFPTDKCYTWGYFPPFEETDVQQLMDRKPKQIHIVWAGRFIPLKHCQDVLHALGQVMRNGYDFIFDLVGDGECSEEYRTLVKQENLTDRVHFWGALPQKQVRDVMKQAHIFIFSSDFNEGWGAVVNEAMNSLCAPIVSHAVGSSGFLIQDHKNGLLYQSRNIQNLVTKIEAMLNNDSMRANMAINAYMTLKESFNGTEAADRLIAFASCALKGEPLPAYPYGPLSLSPIMKNNWFKG